MRRGLHPRPAPAHSGGRADRLLRRLPHQSYVRRYEQVPYTLRVLLFCFRILALSRMILIP